MRKSPTTEDTEGKCFKLEDTAFSKDFVLIGALRLFSVTSVVEILFGSLTYA